MLCKHGEREGRGERSANTGPGWFAVAVQALAVLGHADGVCPSAMVAEQLRAHAVFLRRVFAQLVRAGLVEAREGRDGGYRLARPADQITLADIYRATKADAESGLGPLEAPRGPELDPAMRAALAKVMDEAEKQMLAVLERQTLADISVEAGALKSLESRI